MKLYFVNILIIKIFYINNNKNYIYNSCKQGKTIIIDN